MYVKSAQVSVLYVDILILVALTRSRGLLPLISLTRVVSRLVNVSLTPHYCSAMRPLLTFHSYVHTTHSAGGAEHSSLPPCLRSPSSPFFSFLLLLTCPCASSTTYTIDLFHQPRPHLRRHRRPLSAAAPPLACCPTTRSRTALTSSTTCSCLASAPVCTS